MYTRILKTKTTRRPDRISWMMKNTERLVSTTRTTITRRRTLEGVMTSTKNREPGHYHKGQHHKDGVGWYHKDNNHKKAGRDHGDNNHQKAIQDHQYNITRRHDMTLRMMSTRRHGGTISTTAMRRRKLGKGTTRMG